MQNFQNQIHFTMQAKGGVFKSGVAALTAQYLKKYCPEAIIVDTDPSNQTLVGYEKLNTVFVETLHEVNGEKVLNRAKFDDIMEMIVSISEPLLFDTGSSNYIELLNYIRSNNIFDILADEGKEVYLHIPIVGGQSLIDCLTELEKLSSLPNAKIIIWENHYFGDLKNDKGQSYTENKFYKQAKEKIIGTVKLQFPEMHTDDLKKIVDDSLTFEEVFEIEKGNPKYGFMVKNRLKKVQSEIYEQLDVIFLTEEKAAQEAK